MNNLNPEISFEEIENIGNDLFIGKSIIADKTYWFVINSDNEIIYPIISDEKPYICDNALKLHFGFNYFPVGLNKIQNISPFNHEGENNAQ